MSRLNVSHGQNSSHKNSPSSYNNIIEYSSHENSSNSHNNSIEYSSHNYSSSSHNNSIEYSSHKNSSSSQNNITEDSSHKNSPSSHNNIIEYSSHKNSPSSHNNIIGYSSHKNSSRVIIISLKTPHIRTALVAIIIRLNTNNNSNGDTKQQQLKGIILRMIMQAIATSAKVLCAFGAKASERFQSLRSQIQAHMQKLLSPPLSKTAPARIWP